VHNLLGGCEIHALGNTLASLCQLGWQWIVLWNIALKVVVT